MLVPTLLEPSHHHLGLFAEFPLVLFLRTDIYHSLITEKGCYLALSYPLTFLSGLETV